MIKKTGLNFIGMTEIPTAANCVCVCVIFPLKRRRGKENNGKQMNTKNPFRMPKLNKELFLSRKRRTSLSTEKD